MEAYCEYQGLDFQDFVQLPDILNAAYLSIQT